MHTVSCCDNGARPVARASRLEKYLGVGREHQPEFPRRMETAAEALRLTKLGHSLLLVGQWKGG